MIRYAIGLAFFAALAHGTVVQAENVLTSSSYQSFGNEPAVQPGSSSRYIRIASFNIMAAPWTDPNKYSPIPAEIVDRDYRIAKTIDYLNMARPIDIDVYILQEVTAREFKLLRGALGKNYHSQMAYNAPGYWATEDDLPDPAKWEPNGPAIFARRSTFEGGLEPQFSQHALGDAGNFCITMKARLKDTSTTLRVFGVHLDDTPMDAEDDQLTMMGKKETEALMRLVGVERDNVVDVIAGDLNINLGPRSPLAKLFQNENFVVAVNALNSGNISFATSPYHESDDAVTEEDVYDHILVRRAAPVLALVRHFGAEAIADGDRRAQAFMTAAGSDHYPLEVVIDTKP